MHWYGYLSWFGLMALFALLMTVLGMARQKPWISFDGSEYTVTVHVLGRVGIWGLNYNFIEKDGHYYFRPKLKGTLLLVGFIAGMSLVFAYIGSDWQATFHETINPVIMGTAVAIGMFFPQFVIAHIWMLLNKDTADDLHDEDF